MHTQHRAHATMSASWRARICAHCAHCAHAWAQVSALLLRTALGFYWAPLHICVCVCVCVCVCGCVCVCVCVCVYVYILLGATTHPALFEKLYEKQKRQKAAGRGIMDNKDTKYIPQSDAEVYCVFARVHIHM